MLQIALHVEGEDVVYKVVFVRLHRWPKQLLHHVSAAWDCSSFCFSRSQMRDLQMIEIQRTKQSLGISRLLLLFYRCCIHLHSVIRPV